MEISKNNLKNTIKKMLMEQSPLGSVAVGRSGFGQAQGGQPQTAQQQDQPIEVAILTALQRDTTLTTKLKSISNFNQADTLIKTILGLTRIPQSQIKSGLANLGRMGVATQAKV